jgi:hypothetical protein
MIPRATLSGFVFLFGLPVCASGQDPWWTNRAPVLERLMNTFVECGKASSGAQECDRFIAEALRVSYCVEDFSSAVKGGGTPRANEVAAWIETSDAWELLGEAADPVALRRAQAAANSRLATVAVRTDDPDGHIALILPGEPAASHAWGRLVPNSASYFSHDPERSYVGKPLSYAFRTPTGVRLYVRVYTPCL